MSMWKESADYKKAVEASGQTLLDAASDLWTMVCKVPDEDLVVEHHTDLWWVRHNSNATVEEVIEWCKASVFATDFEWLFDRSGKRDHAKGRGKVLAALMINFLTNPQRSDKSVLARALNAETEIYLVFEGIDEVRTREDDNKRRAYLKQREEEALAKREKAIRTSAEQAS